MQIKTLTIHNIASLADAVIDFGAEPLAEAPIFLISGDTGAGKSTILDAICLALYGNTPRMMSVSKEEIASYDADEKFRFYADDNSQLLRRGTGEGFVSLRFTGNDGKDYDVSWSVQRDYKKPGYKLQRDARRMLVAVDGSFTENNVRPIENKVRELVGMDYNQFCRTVMLAQGEFTKFLKSSGREKAEILEKLTGTEIYSQVGRKIAEKYADKKSIWENLEQQTKNIALLSEDEICAKKAFLAEEEKNLADYRRSRETASKKLSWLVQSAKLSEEKSSLDKRLMELSARVKDESFVADKKLVSDYRESEIAGNSTRELVKLEGILAKNDLLIPEYRASFDAAAKKTEESEKLVAAQSEVVEKNNKEYEAFGVKDLNRKLKSFNARLSVISDISVKNKELATKKEKVADTTDGISNKEKQLEDNKVASEALNPGVAAAEEKVRVCCERLTKVELSLNDAVREMRHNLTKGDVCPVCGHIVDACVEDSYFKSVLDPLRKEKVEAEDELNGLKAQKMAYDKIGGEIKEELAKLGRKLKRETTALKKVEGELETLMKSGGYPLNIAGDELEGRLGSDSASLHGEIENTHDQIHKAEVFLSVLKESQKKEKVLIAALAKDREEEGHIKVALEKAMTDRDNNAKRKEEVAAGLHKFYEEHPSISEGRVAVLMSVEQSVVKKLEDEIDTVEKELTRVQGGMQMVERQLSAMQETRPELCDDDNPEALQQTLDEIEKTVQEKDRAIGQVKEQLKKDDADREKVADIMLRKVSAREDKDRWEGLYRLLGDTSGARFRSVAQSYILKSLLDNANTYVRCFTDRYTLTCNPGSLVIMVEDSFKPGDCQPASILSGGESFMASLSLALGLSGLRGGGMGVDVIFIDEGFGTLSDECLSNVMDTLEKLHQLGGRRVGLISHVSEMKERIPVQIKVHRESPALSRISVVDREYVH